MFSCFLASFTTYMSVYSTKNVMAPGVGFEWNIDDLEICLILNNIIKY